MIHGILIYHPQRAEEYGAALRSLLPGERIKVATAPEEAARALADASVLFCWRFPTALLAQAPHLEWVQSMGAGVEDLVGAPLPTGCRLTRVVGLFGRYMAEYVFLHMLAHAQRLRDLYRDQESARWAPFQIGSLAGKRLGVAGVGSIGSEIARIGKAFGMEVWGLVRHRSEVRTHVDRLFTPAEVDGFTAGADYLVSTLPRTPETTGLIDPLAMKAGALLINIGRGATIREDRLLEAVRSGRIEAVLDVFPTEPLPASHPFWHTPGITVTPHISGPSVPGEVAQFFAENYRRYVSGQPLLGLVDRQRGY